MPKRTPRGKSPAQREAWERNWGIMCLRGMFAQAKSLPFTGADRELIEGVVDRTLTALGAETCAAQKKREARS